MLSHISLVAVLLNQHFGSAGVPHSFVITADSYANRNSSTCVGSEGNRAERAARQLIRILRIDRLINRVKEPVGIYDLHELQRRRQQDTAEQQRSHRLFLFRTPALPEEECAEIEMLKTFYTHRCLH